MDKQKVEALEKLSVDFQALLTRLAKEKGQDDGHVKGDSIFQEQIETMKKDILESIDKKIPVKKKFIFGGDKELKDNEERKSFNDWLLMAKYNHPALADRFSKTVMSEGDNAQGGYLVPTGFDNNIIGELNDATSIIQKCTPYLHAQADGFTKNIPKWLTDLIVYWIDEAGVKTPSKPTLAQKQSILKKVCALVTFTDEELADNTCGLAAKIQKLVGENIASELERLILAGSTVAGDAFNGIYYAAGTNTVPQEGASLAYSDIVGIWNNANVNDKYLKKPEWYLNKTALGLIMNLVDTSGRPLWSLGALAAGIPPNILGDPYNKSQHITNTLGANSDHTAIFYGDYQYVLLGQKAGATGISVVISNSGVISSGVEVVENLLQQDETAYRFVLRRGVLVAIPEAYSVGTEIR